LSYWWVIGGVFVVQAVLSFVTMRAGTGNGSFVGLGAMLFALYGLPATALLNFLLVRRQRQQPRRSNVVWIVVGSSLLPIVQLALLIAVKVFRL
jgi:hypothetical protein